MKMKFYLIVLSLLAVCLWGTGDVRAQSASRSMTVTGKVVDQNGAAVTGASVVVVGTTKGTTTGADGAFSLTGVASDARLAVNFIGYKSQTVEVGGRTSFNIVLVEEATAVDEVVVVGYGQVKKSDLTGSVASVKAEKLTDIPANSIDGLLQGRVAGVQVVNSSQDPGASSTVRIRGNSSLNGSNAPLVVIDGFPWGDAGDLKQINPQDIVSMEVLKDASASAIYGSRGANGVILITTRKAQENVTRITLRQQTTVSGFSSELNLWRDPVLMAMLSNESSINAGLTPTYIGATNANGVYYPSIAELQTTWTTNTRWDDLVFRPTPVSNNTTVQVQSSNDRTMFQASANYYLDNGMYIEDTYRKYGGNFSVEHKLLDNLRMKASANITSNKRHNNGGLAYWRNPDLPGLRRQRRLLAVRCPGLFASAGPDQFAEERFEGVRHHLVRFGELGRASLPERHGAVQLQARRTDHRQIFPEEVFRDGRVQRRLRVDRQLEGRQHRFRGLRHVRSDLC